VQVPTNSVATVADEGLAKSALRSVVQNARRETLPAIPWRSTALE
jgi:hypothetical protein